VRNSPGAAAAERRARVSAQFAGLDALGAELCAGDDSAVRQWQALSGALARKAERRLTELSAGTSATAAAASVEGPFAELGVSAPVAAALAALDIMAPFAIQKVTIPDVLAGRNVIARSATGSGKTLAFGIPLVDGLVDVDSARPGALVLAPTRELVEQIAGAIGRIAPDGLNVAAVFGGAAVGPQARTAAAAHIIVATPGRLLDILGRGAVKLAELRVLVLDEADRLLDDGFSPQVRRIVDRCPGSCQTLLFSATIDDRVRRFAAGRSGEFVEHDHASGEPRVSAAVQHTFVTTDPAGRFGELLQALGAAQGRAIVFVNRKRGATQLARRLGDSGIAVEVIHGDRTQPQRERALEAFRDGRIAVLVATDVLGRGIDVPGVAIVVNYEPPRDPGTFVHRVGRTGRAGSAGIALTLITSDELRVARALRAALGEAPEAGPHEGGSRPGGRRRRRPART
jgi:ATP-dependent RNA helicase RhlE